MAKKLANINRVPKDKTTYTRPEGAGNYDNMDDKNIVDQINIKIGTCDIAPTDDKHIVNKKYVDDTHVPAGSDGEVQFNSSGSFGADDDLFWDNVNKRLGLGITSPEATLHVKKKIRLTGEDASYPSFLCYAHSNTNWHGNFYGFYRSRGTKESPVTMGNYDTVFNFDIFGWDGTGWTRGAQIVASGDGAIAEDKVPMSWRFKTTNTADVAPVNRMIIKGSGNIGIGVDTPQTLLEVNGAISSAVGTFSTTGPTDNVDVDGINTLFIDTSSNNVTIGGLANGEEGQYLNIIKKGSSNILTLEHNEGGGSQDLFLHDGADETIGAGKWGGFLLVCDGSDWWDCQHK